METEAGKFGGSITADQMNEYKEKRIKYMDESIQMYYDVYVHKIPLRKIAKDHNLRSPETVRLRINSLIGEINKLTK